VLDSDTRRKIDTLRDILVGKIPNPQTQVEQITTGLIYKFMDDMDQESIEMGGEGSFFVGDYEKYAWKNLLDPKLSGIDKVNLYSQAIEGMYLNPSAPQLFRDIFKNAFLPFKDPSTLNMFLKEINEFHYSHSEKLGDAFEYLISIMGSQGDAGQFRTPRHIIDFIVEIINPQKNETILDPACGTAGFLISSYKHILKTNTDKKLGDKLSAEDKKKVGENVTGYDISPEMIRLSLVNMYLHGFSTPKIDEYDTLSSEDKWNEYFDVILANPPFFSPKGGIQPHKRFGVQSTKAEVLFTSYILEHLKPNGRAGIIIPEGIIFQTGKAYKELRKQLIENGLVGVISLPAGVFMPYSGVKTSILILDKKLNKERDLIFFAKVNNDGFTLGANRNLTQENDLPELVENIIAFNENKFIQLIGKAVILQDQDFSFNLNKYLETEITRSDYEIVKLNEVGEVSNGYAFKSKEMKKEFENGCLPVLKIGNITKDGNISDSSIQYHCVNSKLENFIVGLKDIVIAMTGATVGKVAEIQNGRYLLNQRVGCLKIGNKINRDYLKFLLISDKFYNYCQTNSEGGAQGNISSDTLENYKIPLPPLEVQQEIVDELEGYQKIIDGCKQVVENYKPTIDIDPSWEMVELGDVCELISGQSPASKYYNENNDGLPFYQGKTEFGDMYLKETKIYTSSITKTSQKGDIVMSVRAPVGPVNLPTKEICIGRGLCAIRPKQDQDLFYLFNILQVKEIVAGHMGATYESINRDELKGTKIPYPNEQLKAEIVEHILEERKVIEGNKKLIETYTQKIKDRINKV